MTCPGNPLATFTSSSGFVANQNPLTLSAGGRITTGMWLTPNLSYRFLITTAGGATVAVMDNVFGSVTQVVTPTIPGTPTTSIQFNNSGTFAGTSNLVWDNINLKLTVMGTSGLNALKIGPGYVQSDGGYLSSVTGGGSWQGFNSLTDGALLRGYHVAQNANNLNGGYINLAPITYNPYDGGTCLDQFGNTVQQPLPLNGLASFGTNSAVLWVGTSPSMPSGGSCGAPLPVLTNYGLFTNTYLLARGGLATDNAAYNSIQSLLGGAYMKLGYTTDQAVYPKGYSASASLNNPASGYGGLGYQSGSIYWYWNGSAWATVDLSSIGGGATPGLPVNSVQFNVGPGSFTGSSNFLWDNTNRLLTITALDSAHAGLGISAGFVQADGGFLATNVACAKYNCFQTPTGGMAGVSFSATKYVNLGNNNGTPTATTGDSFNAGAMYWDTGTHALKVFNDAASWVTVATGGATSPGGSTTNVQFNNAGSFAGTNNFEWLTSGGNTFLQIIGTSTLAPGIVVNPGFVQATNGFLANTCTLFNCFQAAAGSTLTGGFAGVSFTATNYIQLGNYSSGGVGTAPTLTSGDAFHQGALAYDRFGSVGGVGGTLRVYDGANWNAVGGGGGSPAAPVGSVQYNGGSGFAGTSNFQWNNGSSLLTVTGTISASSGYQVSGVGIVDSSRNISNIGTYNGTGNVTTSSAFVSNAVGSSLTFQGGGGTSQINGNGAASFAGVISSTGGSGGVNVTAQTAMNSIQTVGGMSAALGYQISGVTVINSAGAFIGSGGINTTGTGTFGSAITANGGINISTSTNNVLYTGASGNFYTRPVAGASTGVSCGAVLDGWLAVTSDDYVVVCLGGSRFRAALVSF